MVEKLAGPLSRASEAQQLLLALMVLGVGAFGAVTVVRWAPELLAAGWYLVR